MSVNYLPISKIINQSWNSPGTVYIKLLSGESEMQAANRKTADNNILVIDTIIGSKIIINPNVVTPSPTPTPTPTPTPAPIPTGGPVGSNLHTAAGNKPVYIGAIDVSNSYNSNTVYLKPTIVEVNSDGLIRLDNTATGKTPNNGRTIKYHINSNRYVDDISNLWFEPYDGLLISFFWVDTNKPDYTWQVKNEGTDDFFKAFSLINFL